MLSWAIILLAATLALFGYMRYRRVGTWTNDDLEQLRADLDKVMASESKRTARERSALRRNLEEPGSSVSDAAPPSDIGPAGGVVRKEIVTDFAGGTTQAGARRRRA